MDKKNPQAGLMDAGFLFSSNTIYIEELYQKYCQNPGSVSNSWAEFFKQEGDVLAEQFSPVKTTAKVIQSDDPDIVNTENVSGFAADLANKLADNSFIPASQPGQVNFNSANKITDSEKGFLKAKLMINAYRQRGHYLADIDPLNLEIKKTKAELRLNLADFGFSEDQLNEVIEINNEIKNLKNCTLQELVTNLERIYTRSVAAEFAHLQNEEEQQWLYDQLEDINGLPKLPAARQRDILQDLVEIEGFEQYLHIKFPGAKRFSIEGGEAAIICLDQVVEEAAVNGCHQVVLGTAHRGRLSTLTKVMQKPYRAVLSEFEGSSTFPVELDIAGDVKYHMGYSSDKITKTGHNIHLSLTSNPSHLEAVNPVVAGIVRAKQDIYNKDRTMDRTKVTGVLIHGDTAFCGQGIVAESLSMSTLAPYDVGGIFHIVINNQLGFTANNYDSRTGRYCTEIAKAAGVPIIHVNGDDIEAVILVTKIACTYRTKFSRDILVDIVCYRKYGHNEGDEPRYTQNLMYEVIAKKPTLAAIYAESLVQQGVIDSDYYQNAKKDFKSHLDTELHEAEQYQPVAQLLEGNWAGFTRQHNNNEPISKKNKVELTDNSKQDILTGVEKSILVKLGVSLSTIPESFNINPKLAKLFNERLKILTSDQPIDWATGEQLAFASLLIEGTPIRITGQDTERGTFSHRHAVLHSQTDHSTYEPLNNLTLNNLTIKLQNNKPAAFEIADSNLSEYGVLGFEYGYSLANPKSLVIWEAQFGDFANGAQIIIDQFISSAETKWLRMSGLVMLLPHALEGQGPEHSSARLERFLQLAAEDNMQIAYPTTPASIFHLLRRQVKRNFRKPLIIMSPKSLLRHKLAVSDLNTIAEGTKFIPVLDEINPDIVAKQVKRVIFCTGKVYYDLLEAREKLTKTNKQDNKTGNDIVIIRLEQLYPLAQEMIIAIFTKYNNAKKIIWCQEEPKNMGAWEYIRPYLNACSKQADIKTEVIYVGRERSASPAVGYLHTHVKEQEKIITEALGLKLTTDI